MKSCLLFLVLAFGMIAIMSLGYAEEKILYNYDDLIKSELMTPLRVPNQEEQDHAQRDLRDYKLAEKNLLNVGFKLKRIQNGSTLNFSVDREYLNDFFAGHQNLQIKDLVEPLKTFIEAGQRALDHWGDLLILKVNIAQELTVARSVLSKAEAKLSK